MGKWRNVEMWNVLYTYICIYWSEIWEEWECYSESHTIIYIFEGELPFAPTKVWRHLTFEDFLDSLFCFSEVLPLGGKML